MLCRIRIKPWSLSAIKLQGYCNSSEKIILEDACKSLHLSSIDELHKVSANTLAKKPGVSKLLRKYNGKHSMLENIFSEHNWDPLRMDRLPPGFWKDEMNHKKFLDYHGNLLGFESPKEWISIKAAKVELLGGSGLLKYYKSWFHTLESIYPEIDWKIGKKLPRNSEKQHHKIWLDEIQKKLSINDPRDLYSVSIDTFKKYGKTTTLLKIYGNKDNMVKEIYPEIHENNSKFDERFITSSFWKSEINQKKYLEWLLNDKLKLEKENWGKVQKIDLKSNKGNPLLSKYLNLFDMFQNLYPEIKWDPFSGDPLPQGYWDLEENQKSFLLQLEKNNSISDWSKVTKKYLTKYHAQDILKKYPNITNAICTLFPEKNYSPTQIEQSIDYNKIENQKMALQKFAEAKKLSSLEEWNCITRKDLQQFGLTKILCQYKSIFDMLDIVFDNYPWKLLNNKLPLGFWDDINNHRKFLDQLGNSLSYSKFEDWYSITKNVIKMNGGSQLLRKYSSIYDMMKQVYPKFDWEFYSFPVLQKYWNSTENQKDFLIFICNKFNIDTTDLIILERDDYIRMGGSGLLKKYKNIPTMLQMLYPDINWNIFQRKKVPYNYWKDQNNVKQFLEKFKLKYKISSVNDWERVSWKQIKQEGGSGLVTYFNSSLFDMLSRIYPNENWNKENLQRSNKKSSQKWLFTLLKNLFVGKEIIEEYFEFISRESGIALELDIFLPEIKLAFEYNGEQHYKEIPAFGSAELYKTRDMEKKILCTKNNIHLIIIPYTWDNTVTSLKNEIYLYDTINSTNFTSLIKE